MSKRDAESQKRVSEKIAVLIREGTDRKQAAAIAFSMERAGRLRRKGKYTPAGKERHPVRPSP